GQSVKFTVSAFPEKTFTGAISQVRINPIVKPQGQIVSYESLVTCDNSELLLKPGMTATATVVVYHREKVLRVPNEAFIVSPVETEKADDLRKKYIWKKKALSMEKLPVERIEVKTGVMGDFFTEILSNNIKEGDNILTGIEKKLESNKGMYDL
ncbi:MAG: efflux RND transporter periplasmic adaptor subunit, partial [Spirochaetes bacterium]|nr:efflux RND transporter periplasmic adaptor subunit [Spirochaetota bacterium]